MRKPIDFSQVIEEINEQGDSKTIEVDELDPSEVHRAEPYYQYFEKDTIKLLFSKKWQNKEDGYKKINHELKTLLKEESDKGEDSGGHMISFKQKKQEWIKLVISCIERGINDKIIHVKLHALELLKTLIEDENIKFLDVQNSDNIFKFLIDGLSEHNLRLKEKFENSLHWVISRKTSDFYNLLIQILNKPPNKNKPLQKYNYSKLNFLTNSIEREMAEDGQLQKIDRTKSDPFFNEFLDFISSITKKEKAITKEVKEGIEKAIIVAYKYTSYDRIKDYIKEMDQVVLK